MPNRILELEAALADAKRKDREDAKIALEAIPINYIWKVTWKSKHVVRITRNLAPETLENFKTWKTFYPKQSYPSHYENNWHGMDYVVIGNAIVSVGGGHLLLKAASKDPFDHEPLFMTDQETKLLKDGIVADSLKR